MRRAAATSASGFREKEISGINDKNMAEVLPGAEATPPRGGKALRPSGAEAISMREVAPVGRDVPFPDSDPGMTCPVAGKTLPPRGLR